MRVERERLIRGTVRLGAIALALLLPAGIAWAGAEEEAEFVKRFAWVEKQGREGRWKLVAQKLRELLGEHREADYVLAKRAAIVDLMKRSVFRDAHAVPTAGDVVSGKLIHHRPDKGTLKIRYDMEHMDDWRREAEWWVHPAVFVGPHVITFHGVPYDTDQIGAQAVVCLDGDRSIHVGFGLDLDDGSRRVNLAPVRILVRDKDRTIEERIKVKSLSTTARSFPLRIAVRHRAVTAAFQTTRMLTCPKDPERWGRIAFVDDGKVTGVTLDGAVEKAWIAGLIDRADSAAWARFEPTFRAREHLPAWLFAVPAATGTGPRADHAAWPCVPGPGELKLIAAVEALLETGGTKEALARVEAALETDANLRIYLRAKIHLRAGRYGRALDACDLLLARHGDFPPAELLRASLLWTLRREEEAYRACQVLRSRYPGDPDLQAEVVLLFLRAGRLEKAGKALEVALRRGLDSPSLARVNRFVTKARQGPAWSRSFDYRSKHYHVFSDIDRATCVEASRILEQAHTAYSAWFDRARVAPSQPFVVYLFSGQEGYVRYADELMGAGNRFSAGLYSPLLKQLLVWNAPTRESMLQTIRHEGFHQYLDSVLPDPPLWFNEGLATYFEVARVGGKGWVLGERNAPRIESLRRRGMIEPLGEFLFQGPVLFMNDAELHYAEAWALIHFLRHTTAENRRLFRRFWEAFKTVPSHEEAIRQALGERPLDALDREFRAHVAALLAGK